MQTLSRSMWDFRRFEWLSFCERISKSLRACAFDDGNAAYEDYVEMTGRFHFLNFLISFWITENYWLISISSDSIAIAFQKSIDSKIIQCRSMSGYRIEIAKWSFVRFLYWIGSRTQRRMARSVNLEWRKTISQADEIVIGHRRHTRK